MHDLLLSGDLRASPPAAVDPNMAQLPAIDVDFDFEDVFDGNLADDPNSNIFAGNPFDGALNDASLYDASPRIAAINAETAPPGADAGAQGPDAGVDDDADLESQTGSLDLNQAEPDPNLPSLVMQQPALMDYEQRFYLPQWED